MPRSGRRGRGGRRGGEDREPQRGGPPRDRSAERWAPRPSFFDPAAFGAGPPVFMGPSPAFGRGPPPLMHMPLSARMWPRGLLCLGDLSRGHWEGEAPFAALDRAARRKRLQMWLCEVCIPAAGGQPEEAVSWSGAPDPVGSEEEEELAAAAGPAQPKRRWRVLVPEGVGVRRTKDWEDKIQDGTAEAELAGSPVQGTFEGVDEGDGWVRRKYGYLPRGKGRTPILAPNHLHEGEDEWDGLPLSDMVTTDLASRSTASASTASRQGHDVAPVPGSFSRSLPQPAAERVFPHHQAAADAIATAAPGIILPPADAAASPAGNQQQSQSEHGSAGAPEIQALIARIVQQQPEEQQLRDHPPREQHQQELPAAAHTPAEAAELREPPQSLEAEQLKALADENVRLRARCEQLEAGRGLLGAAGVLTAPADAEGPPPLATPVAVSVAAPAPGAVDGAEHAAAQTAPSVAALFAWAPGDSAIPIATPVAPHEHRSTPAFTDPAVVCAVAAAAWTDPAVVHTVWTGKNAQPPPPRTAPAPAGSQLADSVSQLFAVATAGTRPAARVARSLPTATPLPVATPAVAPAVSLEGRVLPASWRGRYGDLWAASGGAASAGIHALPWKRKSAAASAAPPTSTFQAAESGRQGSSSNGPLICACGFSTRDVPTLVVHRATCCAAR
eukprot:TRINITY_DN12430_c0_g1_i3.p1 TRINITY_DN12430_c0_g1~~TRINITY_DN12430_c0_g1_i3.p1  ORF type:complete len:672 (+),score=133.52 TRINITY_DN12430_c0_g1_i3:101-2116(+)